MGEPCERAYWAGSGRRCDAAFRRCTSRKVTRRALYLACKRSGRRGAFRCSLPRVEPCVSPSIPARRFARIRTLSESGCGTGALPAAGVRSALDPRSTWTFRQLQETSISHERSVLNQPVQHLPKTLCETGPGASYAEQTDCFTDGVVRRDPVAHSYSMDQGDADFLLCDHVRPAEGRV